MGDTIPFDKNQKFMSGRTLYISTPPFWIIPTAKISKNTGRLIWVVTRGGNKQISFHLLAGDADVSAGLALPKEIFVHGLLPSMDKRWVKTAAMSLTRLIWRINSAQMPPDICSLSQFPASEHGDVKADDFANKYNSDLANGVGNQLERSFTMMIDYSRWRSG